MECIEALKTRRSIRKFTDKNPDLNIIIKAISIARYAPSAKNSQPWRFIIIRDKKIIDKLSRLHRGASPLSNAKIAVVVIANKEESPVSYMVDASLATMYLWLALHCMGLGAVWIQTLRNTNEINNILGIPNNYVPVAILAIGYPDEKPEPRPRRPLSEIVYIDKYGNKIENVEKST